MFWFLIVNSFYSTDTASPESIVPRERTKRITIRISWRFCQFRTPQSSSTYPPNGCQTELPTAKACLLCIRLKLCRSSFPAQVWSVLRFFDIVSRLGGGSELRPIDHNCIRFRPVVGRLRTRNFQNRSTERPVSGMRLSARTLVIPEPSAQSSNGSAFSCHPIARPKANRSRQQYRSRSPVRYPIPAFQASTIVSSLPVTSCPSRTVVRGSFQHDCRCAYYVYLV